MPAYEITYRYEDGSLIAQIETFCASDKEAKILAHAMRMDGARQFEVWREEMLVYARPQHRMRQMPFPAEARV
ncbi:MAG TPA: hypothetical protein VG867_01465 [Rhizomicrobium sp.]|nr:hypothetical protein [Rhizomicrobium sp.]